MKKKTRETTLRTKNAMSGLAFLTPWIIGLAVFTLYPIGYSVMMSVSKLELVDEDEELQMSENCAMMPKI
jgi:ABC-type sugar transport system permease subunit